MGEKWADMSPRERAALIRAHFTGRKPVSADAVCWLFNLTPAGLEAIRAGAEWMPEHMVDPAPDDTP